MPADLVTARSYISEAKNMAKRHVLRIDPALKQLYCKRCNCILPRDKATSSIKLNNHKGKGKKKSRQQFIAIDCVFCSYTNNIPLKYWCTPEIAIKHPPGEENKEDQN